MAGRGGRGERFFDFRLHVTFVARGADPGGPGRVRLGSSQNGGESGPDIRIARASWKMAAQAVLCYYFQ